MTDSKRTYTKIDEFTFTVEEDRHLQENMKIDEKFSYLAQLCNGLKECVKNANEFQDKFIQIVNTYNFYVDLLTEAKEQCGYEYKIPERIELPDCFDIIEVKVENIPVIDFKMKDEEKKAS